MPSNELNYGGYGVVNPLWSGKMGVRGHPAGGPPPPLQGGWVSEGYLQTTLFDPHNYITLHYKTLTSTEPTQLMGRRARCLEE